MGLAYNEPHHNDGSALCKACDANVLETEMHVLFHCSETEAPRTEALQQAPWLKPRYAETPIQHFSRVGKTR